MPRTSGVIQFRPGNEVKLAYASRVNDDVWAPHESVIKSLHAARYNANQILETLNAEHSFQPSIGQLRGKLRKWGLQASTARHSNPVAEDDYNGGLTTPTPLSDLKTMFEAESQRSTSHSSIQESQNVQQTHAEKRALGVSSEPDHLMLEDFDYDAAQLFLELPISDSSEPHIGEWHDYMHIDPTYRLDVAQSENLDDWVQDALRMQLLAGRQGREKANDSNITSAEGVHDQIVPRADEVGSEISRSTFVTQSPDSSSMRNFRKFASRIHNDLRPQRVHKEVRRRRRDTCHRCNKAFGSAKTCTSCHHKRCFECPRHPSSTPIKLDIQNTRGANIANQLQNMTEFSAGQASTS